MTVSALLACLFLFGGVVGLYGLLCFFRISLRAALVIAGIILLVFLLPQLFVWPSLLLSLLPR